MRKPLLFDALVLGPAIMVIGLGIAAVGCSESRTRITDEKGNLVQVTENQLDLWASNRDAALKAEAMKIAEAARKDRQLAEQQAERDLNRITRELEGKAEEIASASSHQISAAKREAANAVENIQANVDVARAKESLRLAESDPTQSLLELKGVVDSARADLRRKDEARAAWLDLGVGIGQAVQTAAGAAGGPAGSLISSLLGLVLAGGGAAFVTKKVADKRNQARVDKAEKATEDAIQIGKDMVWSMEVLKRKAPEVAEAMKTHAVAISTAQGEKAKLLVDDVQRDPVLKALAA
jgi:hypothetical protein